MNTTYIQNIKDTEDLEERLSRPNDAVVAALSNIDGDIMVLGAGGKMGPSLSRMVRRAADLIGSKRRVIAVSRFSGSGVEAMLCDNGVETLRCDLMEPEQLDSLPDCQNIIYMAGMKFGTSGSPSQTWAMNVDLPAMVCRRFKSSRFAAFSTGNVYAMVTQETGGSRETDSPDPVGEYAMSCLGRERVFEYYSNEYGLPVSIIRLSYALEVRYGVLLDIALSVYNDKPVNLAVSSFCGIWQGDANALAIQALSTASSPPDVLNITGTDILSVREIAGQFGSIFHILPRYTGSDCGRALLSSTQKMQRLFGQPQVPIDEMVRWTADWVRRGGVTHDKPTHFETTDGRF